MSSGGLCGRRAAQVFMGGPLPSLPPLAPRRMLAQAPMPVVVGGLGGGGGLLGALAHALLVAAPRERAPLPAHLALDECPAAKALSLA